MQKICDFILLIKYKYNIVYNNNFTDPLKITGCILSNVNQDIL